jgi:hypothetical protein
MAKQVTLRPVFTNNLFPTRCVTDVSLAVPQLRRLVAGGPGSSPNQVVGFVVDKVALGKVFFEYFGVSCQFSFHRLLHTHHLSFGAGTRGQLVAEVPSGLSLTPPQET